MIKHEGDKWNVYTADGSHKLGSHSNKQDAMKQLQAIEISKHAGEPGATKPKKRQLGSHE